MPSKPWPGTGHFVVARTSCLGRPLGVAWIRRQKNRRSRYSNHRHTREKSGARSGSLLKVAGSSEARSEKRKFIPSYIINSILASKSWGDRSIGIITGVAKTQIGGGFEGSVPATRRVGRVFEAHLHRSSGNQVLVGLEDSAHPTHF